MPKFMMNATGDQFFAGLVEVLPRRAARREAVRYVPNTDHSVRGSDAWLSLTAFYIAVLTGAPLPSFTWQIYQDGAIRVRAADTPIAVTLWQATNPGARDFRLSSIGRKWTSSPLEAQADGEYVARVSRPFRGLKPTSSS